MACEYFLKIKFQEGNIEVVPMNKVPSENLQAQVRAKETTTQKHVSLLHWNKIFFTVFAFFITSFYRTLGCPIICTDRFHGVILVIDTSNNASYNQVHWLVRTPYLSIKAGNGVVIKSTRMGIKISASGHKTWFSILLNENHIMLPQ